MHSVIANHSARARPVHAESPAGFMRFTINRTRCLKTSPAKPGAILTPRWTIPPVEIAIRAENPCQHLDLGTDTRCIAYWYAFRMTQLVTRIDDSLAASMDELIAQGAASSRSELVRMGLERLIDERRRIAIGLHIVSAYTETPQTNAENSELDAATRALILEEPW